MENDDWFYESIQNYKTLQMYDLQMKPLHMIKVADDSLGLAGVDTVSGKTEILCMEMPAKLMLPEEEGNRCKGNDFNIKCGGFFNKNIYKIGMANNENKMIVAFQNQIGLNFIDLDLNQSKINKGTWHLLKQDMKTPNFAINPQDSELLATKFSSHPIILYDYLTEKTKTISPPNSMQIGKCEINCSYLGPDLGAFLNTSTGLIALVDLRTCLVSLEIKGACSGSHVYANDGVNLIATLSKGTIRVYDMRVASKILAMEHVDKNDDKVAVPTLEFGSSHTLSLSGLDGNVYIFDMIENSLVHGFTHQGHAQTEGAITVTDHLWLPNIAPNFVVSCADNGSLNCWEFIRMSHRSQ